MRKSFVLQMSLLYLKLHLRTTVVTACCLIDERAGGLLSCHAALAVFCRGGLVLLGRAGEGERQKILRMPPSWHARCSQPFAWTADQASHCSW